MLPFFSKKKLIVSGCSLTDNYASTQNLETFPIWPNLLAEKLNMECINLGKCGAGNKEIFSKLLDAIVKEKNVGLVVPMWTEFQRVSFFIDSLNTWKSFHPDRDYLNAEWNDQFYKKDNPLKNQMAYIVSENLRRFQMQGMEAGTMDSIRMMYTLQSICQHMGINYLQIQGCLPIMQKKNSGESDLCKIIIDNDYFDKISSKTFIGWPIMPQISGNNCDSFLDKIDPDRKMFRISDEDSHPNALGHKEISEIIYDQYQKIYS